MTRSKARRWLACSMAVAALGLAGTAPAADGDPEAGARKSIFCAYCHGPDGNPPDEAAPRLAGQPADVLVTKMQLQTEALGAHELMVQAFRTGRALNDRDMNDLAAYFSRQPVRQTVEAAKPAN